ANLAVHHLEVPRELNLLAARLVVRRGALLAVELLPAPRDRHALLLIHPLALALHLDRPRLVVGRSVAVAGLASVLRLRREGREPETTEEQRADRHVLEETHIVLRLLYLRL